MYVENDALLLLQKLTRVPLKKKISLVYKTMRVMCIYSSIEVVYIWTIAPFSLSGGFWWFPVVSTGFPWLSLVITGYPWLPHGDFF